MFDSQIILKTHELDYLTFHEKDKTLKNLIMAIDNLKVMSSFLGVSSKKTKAKDIHSNTRIRQSSIVRKSTLKRVDGKKSGQRMTLKNSNIEKDSPTLINEEYSENDSPSLSPQRSRMSIFIKKKISEEKSEK